MVATSTRVRAAANYLNDRDPTSDSSAGYQSDIGRRTATASESAPPRSWSTPAAPRHGPRRQRPRGRASATIYRTRICLDRHTLLQLDRRVTMLPHQQHLPMAHMSTREDGRPSSSINGSSNSHSNSYGSKMSLISSRSRTSTSKISNRDRRKRTGDQRSHDITICPSTNGSISLSTSCRPRSQVWSAWARRTLS